MKLKDNCFDLFCHVVNEIPDYHSNKAKKDAIQEEWSMFLKRAEY